jgi:hypothetical protein
LKNRVTATSEAILAGTQVPAFFVLPNDLRGDHRIVGRLLMQ